MMRSIPPRLPRQPEDLDEHVSEGLKVVLAEQADSEKIGLFRFLVRASRDLWAFLLGEGRFPRHSHLSPEDPKIGPLIPDDGQERQVGAYSGLGDLPAGEDADAIAIQQQTDHHGRIEGPGPRVSSW